MATKHRDTSTPSSVRGVDVHSLEKGRHDLLFHLADDGLGFPLYLPAIVVRGGEGPLLAMVAGVHGNELNGIWVIHEVVRALEKRKKLNGTVLAIVIANAPGVVRHARAFSDGNDLNRLFPGRARGTPSQIWAHRVTKQLEGVDYLLDFHTAGAGRQNSVYARVDLDDKRSRTLARVFGPQLIVHKPANDKSLRGWAATHSIPAVTLEVGDPQRYQDANTKLAVRGTLRVLRHCGLIGGRAPEEGPQSPEYVKSKWIYTTRGGLLEVWPDVGAPVAKGEVVGVLRDVFGRELERYESPSDGHVVGKTADPIAQTGSRVLHLAFKPAG